MEERHVRRHRDEPSRTERKVRFHLTVSRDQEAIVAARFQAGWRIYAANAPREHLSLGRAVLAYQPVASRRICSALAGQVSSITANLRTARRSCAGPLSLPDPGARLLAMGDYLARQALAAQRSTLTGIYPAIRNMVRQTH